MPPASVLMEHVDRRKETYPVLLKAGEKDKTEESFPQRTFEPFP